MLNNEYKLYLLEYKMGLFGRVNKKYIVVSFKIGRQEGVDLLFIKSLVFLNLVMYMLHKTKLFSDKITAVKEILYYPEIYTFRELKLKA
jgi:hypothetical protein